jgi:septum formation inhibitor-activating ATPase MinD
MKRDVDRIIGIIGSMKNAKEQKKETTRNLEVLAAKVSALWQ